MAASTAEPPARRASTPACEASECGLVTMPLGASVTGRPVVMSITGEYSIFLDVGDAQRHAEFLAADLGEHGDAVADGLRLGIGEAETQAVFGVALVGRPFRPRIERHAGSDRRQRQLLRVDVLGHLD